MSGGGARVAIVGVGHGPAPGQKPTWPHGVPPRLRSYDGFTLLAVAAAMDAADSAGWGAEILAGERAAFALGSAFGSHATNEEYYQGVLGRAAVSPRLFTYTLPSSPLGELSIHYKQTGAQDTCCAGWTSGASALAAAAARLRAGTADHALCIGADLPGRVTREALEEAAGGRPLDRIGVALAMARVEAGGGGSGEEEDAPGTVRAPHALLAGSIAGFADPALGRGAAREGAAGALRRALAAAGRAPGDVDRAIIASPPALCEASLEALADTGVRASAMAGPALPPAAETAGGTIDPARAMGAAPLVAAAALALAPRGAWRVATVLTLCYCGPLSALVFTR